MSGPITTNSQVPLNLDQLNQNQKYDPKQAGVGAGWVVSNGETPPAPPPPETVANAIASLAEFMKGGQITGDVDVLLIQIAVAMRDTEAKNEKSKINTDQEAKKAEMREKEHKLEEAAKKLQEALDKKNSSNIFDKIKLAFEWLGAILAVALAAVMIATGVGAVVGGLLIAAAVTAVVMAVDSTVAAATGMGIAGNIAYAAAKAEGKTDAEAKEIAGKADMGFKISLAILGIAFSLAAGGVGAANSFRSAIQAGKDAAEMGAKIKDIVIAAKTAFMQTMEQSGAAVSQTMQLMAKGLSVGEGVNTAAIAGTEIGKAVVKYEETEARSDAKKLEADAKQHEAMMQILDDMIDQALTRLMAASDRFNTMLDEIVEAMNDRGNTMARARFTG